VAPDQIALHGAAPELVTLARLALARGLRVAWHHPDPKAAAASLAALDFAEAAEQRAGRLSAAARAAGRARLQDGGEAPLHIHADPVSLPGVADGPVRLLLGGAETVAGLAIAPLGASCELSLPPHLAPDAASDGLALAVAGLRRLGLQPVLVGQRPILGRGLVTAGRTALARLVARGVTKARIAAALESFGARLPAGLPDPEVSGPDLDAADMGASEIVARWLGALANEGFRLLDQGIARRPSDIDLVLVAGHGFPRWQGGPMHMADRRGLMALRADLRLWAADDPIWAPAPGLDRMIRDGMRLEALDLRA
jgi:3-hydroxyacyl-CoA dehydrogenase